MKKILLVIVLCFSFCQWANADWLIIDKNTKVIRCITSDESPTISDTCEKQEVADGMKLYPNKKWIDSKMIDATKEDLALANKPTLTTEALTSKTAIDTMLKDETVPKTLKNAFIELKKQWGMD